MRIQVNKYAREEFSGLDNFLMNVSPFCTMYSGIERNRFVKACICPECGAELYGAWITYKCSLTYKQEAIYRFGAPTEYVDAVPAGIKQQGKRLDAQFNELWHCANAEMDEDITCPVCGRKNKYQYSDSSHDWLKNGNSDKDSISNIIDDVINLAISCVLDKKNAYEEAKRYSKQCNISISGSIGAGERIKGDSAMLKQYVFSLIQLETNILSLTKRLQELYHERDKAELCVRQAKYEPIYAAKLELESANDRFNEAKSDYERYLQIVSSRRAKTPAPVNIPMPTMPSEPDYQKPGLLNRKKVEAHNAALKAQYDKEMHAYERKCQKRLCDIELRNNENMEKHRLEVLCAEEDAEAARIRMESLRVIPDQYTATEPLEICPANARFRLIGAEIEKTQEMLINIYKARNELYAENVIFEKYRNLVALSTFYEYLASCRCDSLEGPNGAYNLYEAEVRANLIISKLSEIEKTLERIEQAQYTIYSLLTEMNASLNEISSTMSTACSAIMDIRTNTRDMDEYMASISRDANVIAHNTATTAYYAKMNAELTNALGFMVALK